MSLGRFDLAVALALVAGAFSLAPLALRVSRPIVIDFGPNDQDYVTNFREDWEPEGRTRFHWTGVQARVELPVLAQGAGHVLRLRVRRHFLEPAHVTLRVEGRAFARFDVRAEDGAAWRVLELPLPPLVGRGPFVLDIDAPSANPRPLGIALDWAQLERGAPTARIGLPLGTRTRLALVCLVMFLVPRLAGLGRRAATLLAAGACVASAWGLSLDALAAERILREGAGGFTVVAAVALALLRSPRACAWLRVEARTPAAGILAALVLLALAVRLTLLLHPRFYYPDVRIHAVFARELAKVGLPAFLRDFTENQFRFSLGLQFERGHWYAFPYPPAFYVLCWPLLKLLHFRPEVAVSLAAAVVNSFEALLAHALGRRLSQWPSAALLAAAAAPLLPIFVTRLSLGYFPALVGHAADMVALVALADALRGASLARLAGLATLIATSLLTYTQGLLNWGLLLPLYLTLGVLGERSRTDFRAHARLALAGVLGAILSLVFYGRYIPTFLDMQRGLPMAEERVLAEKLERQARAAHSADAGAEEPDDPFAGPGIDPIRGLRKAAWRLYVFYGIFGLAVVVGLGLVWRAAPGPAERRLLLTWALVYVLLNLASGGLPGPNLVRYNKDHEIVAPLFSLALAHATLALWDRRRVLGIAFALSFQGYAAVRAAHSLTERFFTQGRP